jgi:hypothetical protein
MLPAIIAALAPVLIGEVAKQAMGDAPAAGKVAEAAVSVVSQVVGLPIVDEDSARAAAGIVTSDPAKLAEVYRLQAECVVTLLRLDNEDRENARAREIALRDPTPQNLAYVIFGGFLAYAFAILIGAAFGAPGFKDPLVAGLIGTGFGALGAEAARIGNYYFGSSAGSRAKTEMLKAR